ncbi:hypothetical protein AVEN_132112-1, partial [Araneus ventricosus]
TVTTGSVRKNFSIEERSRLRGRKGTHCPIGVVTLAYKPLTPNQSSAGHRQESIICWSSTRINHLLVINKNESSVGHRQESIICWSSTRINHLLAIC